jgi:hypothetical protein
LPDETAVEEVALEDGEKRMSTAVTLMLFAGMCCALQWQWFASRMATLRTAS